MNKNKEKDRCILCESETPHDKDEHVDKRFCYVDGAGQLCKSCWDSVYGKFRVD